MSHIPSFQPKTTRMLLKTGSYYILHIMVAAMVAYAVTGNLVASLTLSLLEPTVQAFAYFFHERAWERAAKRKEAAAQAMAAAAPPAATGGGRALAGCPSAPRQAD